MYWERLVKHQLKKEPVPHIIASRLVAPEVYDALYENQNNLQHHTWKNFQNEFDLEFDFKEDIKNIDLTEPVIALWLFRERADRGSSPDINLAGKPIKYAHNTFIITKSKDIKIIEKSKIYIRRPFVQFKMSVAEFDKIVESLK